MHIGASSGLVGLIFAIAACGGHEGMVDAGRTQSQPSSQANATCKKLCALADPLHCPNDTTPCMSDCTGFYDGAVCTSELRALIACGIAHPASEWECNANGEAAVSMAGCAAEDSRAKSCVANGGRDAGRSPGVAPGVTGSPVNAANSERACNALAPCMHGCFDGVLLTDACATAIEAASCKDDALDIPPWNDVCFPLCKNAGAQCNGDGTVTLCTLVGGSDNRGLMTFSCELVCKSYGRQFSGTCVGGNDATFNERKACPCNPSQ